MKLLASVCSLMLFAFASLAGAADDAGKLARADASAMKKLAGANLAEIEAGKLAASRAQNAEVKKFGQHMVGDHTKMLDDLKDHQKDVKETDKIISKAKDADFKQAVQDASAKIKEHLQMAQQVDQSVKGSASRGTSKAK